MSLQRLAVQPEQRQFYADDDLCVVLMGPLDAGMHVPQHAHAYQHPTAIVAGRFEVWNDGNLVGVFNAPKIVTIPARTKHKFVSLKAGGMLACFHNLHGHGEPLITEEHEIV